MAELVAGIDLGGTAINYTLLDRQGNFLISGLCEHPALTAQGPEICIGQMAEGLQLAAKCAGANLGDIAAAGLGTPGPASASGVLSQAGSTNFNHPGWSGYDIRSRLEAKLRLPVTSLNDGNAAALWGHAAVFGAEGCRATSIAVIVGTGLGGGVIVNGQVVTGRRGFGGELGDILIPYANIAALEPARDLVPRCNCGRIGDIESLCSLTAIARNLLPRFLADEPAHELHAIVRAQGMAAAARQVRGLAQRGDRLCRTIFQVQAQALALLFDTLIAIFDPDALILGGGAIEAGADFQRWFLDQIRAGMPPRPQEQRDLPIILMPEGDCAGARGAALEARRQLDRTGPKLAAGIRPA